MDIEKISGAIVAALDEEYGKDGWILLSKTEADIMADAVEMFADFADTIEGAVERIHKQQDQLEQKYPTELYEEWN